MSDNTLTVWEIDKEVTIAAFAGYLTFGNPFEGEHRAMAEDLFAEIQGREIVLTGPKPASRCIFPLVDEELIVYATDTRIKSGDAWEWRDD